MKIDLQSKVALAHDYLREYGGAERVLEVLHEIFPNAPVFTAYYNPKALGEHAQKFASWDIRTSWMQKIPFANKLISPFRIFAALMFESFDLSEYDLVISSSSAIYFAKSVITKPKTLHISYIHTPPRFLYGYATSFNYKKHFWTRIGGEIMNHILRIYDYEISQRPDILVANSENIRARIKKFYRRDSVVIYPPVGMKKFEIRNSKFEIKDKKYFLSLGRLVRGKGVDIIVEACSKLGLPLKVVGSGPELEILKELSGKGKEGRVEFLGEVKDEDLSELYASAKALIVASEDEDFGITPVEAQLVGTPVIAPRSGGFLETVVEGSPRSAGGAGQTGVFYGGPGQVTAEGLMEALKKFKQDVFKAEDCIKNAQKFSKSRFKKEILELVEKHLK